MVIGTPRGNCNDEKGALLSLVFSVEMDRRRVELPPLWRLVDAQNR